MAREREAFIGPSGDHSDLRALGQCYAIKDGPSVNDGSGGDWHRRMVILRRWGEPLQRAHLRFVLSITIESMIDALPRPTPRQPATPQPQTPLTARVAGAVDLCVLRSRLIWVQWSRSAETKHRQGDL